MLSLQIPSKGNNINELGELLSLRRWYRKEQRPETREEKFRLDMKNKLVIIVGRERYSAKEGYKALSPYLIIN